VDRKYYTRAVSQNRRKTLSQADGLEGFLTAYLFQRQEALQIEDQIFGRPPQLEPELSFLYFEDGSWRLSALAIPTEWWSPDPSGMLAKISGIFTMLSQEEPQLMAMTEAIKPETWRGLAFISESWIVQQYHDDGKIDPVLEAMAKNRMLSQHPAREPALVATAILHDGTACQAWITQIENGTSGSFVCSPDEPAPVGRVPESLSAIITALGG
jgi:hypothetical protein